MKATAPALQAQTQGQIYRRPAQGSAQLVRLERYKLVSWAPGSSSVELQSSMHATVDEALRAAERFNGQPYLVMESTHVGDGEYRWRVLPLGSSSLWTFGNHLYQLRWILAVILVVAGIYLISQNSGRIES